jgi:pyruvate/2-oxoglutarate dehydrogenase complex dihydrolipoamide dehydrogenase (E3) component
MRSERERLRVSNHERGMLRTGGGIFMADDFDVVVIGAGVAGENAAGRCADGGLATAIVEGELVGGECSFWGCVPSKTLIRPGDVLAAARRVPGAAEAITGDIDVTAALAQRDYMTNDWSDDTQTPWLETEGIELVRGHGRLSGTRTVEVTQGSSHRTLTARRAIVVATGTAPRVPPIEGLDGVRIWDNRDVTEAKEIPARLLVLGGGTIGVEMAQAFKRLGSEEVTVIEAGPRLLSREEPFAGERLKEAFEAEGIRILTQAKMTSVRRDGVDGPVTASLADGSEISADEILVAVGRAPKTSDLGLESVGLEGGGWLEVDDMLRVKGVDDDWLYAVGDCNGRALLTHMGKYQGRIAADVILGKDISAEADNFAIPRVTFTDPQVAAAGLTEREARERAIDIRVVSYDIGGVAGSYTRGNDIRGTCSIVVDQSNRIIVGATFTGPDVQEIVHAATVAIVAHVPLERLWHAVPSFPTMSEVWLRLLEAYGL